MKTISIFLFANFVVLSACTEQKITNPDGTPIPPGEDGNDNQSNSWLIPQNEDEWHKLAHTFFSSHRCQSPMVWQMPKELYEFVWSNPK